MTLAEAYARGALVVLGVIGSVFAYRLINDLYSQWMHGNMNTGNAG